jgi:hypothetical protein
MRRECLDHVVVIGQRHLRRVLTRYLSYYHASRTHLSLDKDAPTSRRTQRTTEGRQWSSSPKSADYTIDTSDEPRDVDGCQRSCKAA